MKSNPLVMTVVVAAVAGVVGLGIGFEVRGMPQFSRFGMMNQQAAGNFGGRGARGANGAGGNQNGAPGFAGRGMNGAVGTITAMDDKSITVKMPDGSSKIVLISDTTTYETTTKADKTGLKTGATVRVLGTSNSDGSVTGTDVMLNPALPTQMMTPTTQGK